MIRGLCLALVLLALNGCDAPQDISPESVPTRATASPDLVAVPHPDPAAFKPEITASLRPARAVFDAQARASEGLELGAAYGKLGLHYQAHQQQLAARACFENAATLNPDDHRWPYYLAVHFEETGEFDNAIAKYREALALRADNLAARTRLGLLQIKLGELDDAQELLTRVASRDPNSAAALAGLGDIAGEQGNSETAAELYRSALDIDPSASQLHYRLGLVYRKLGDIERARLELAQRGERIPRIADPLLVVMQAHLHSPAHYVALADDALGAEDMRQAARFYAMALTVAPTDAPALTKLGELLLAVKQDDAARERFEQLVAAHPDDALGHYYLGLCAARAGDRDAAVAHMQRALEIDPQHERATRAMQKMSAAR